MREWIDGSTGSTTFECHCKNKESWMGRKFSLLQPRLLFIEIYEEVFCVHVTLSKHATNYGSQSCFNLTISHREASPIHSSGKRRVALWVRLSSGTFNFNLHSLSSVNKYLQLYLLLLLYICWILRVQYIGQFDLFIVYI